MAAASGAPAPAGGRVAAWGHEIAAWLLVLVTAGLLARLALAVTG